MNSYDRIYNLLVEMQQRPLPLKTGPLAGKIFRHTEDGKIFVRDEEGGPWREEKPVDEEPKKK